MDFKWKRRDDQWIKANPNKPYMYKEFEDGTILEQCPVLPITKQRSPKIASNSGTYVIICHAEKHAYVGQSKNLGSRLRSHKAAIQNSCTTFGSSYIKMREHCKKHGILAFDFIIHSKCENSIEILLKEEARAMHYYVQQGYTLYNRVVSACEESIFCPENWQKQVKQVVVRLQTDPVFADKLNNLLII